MACPLCPNPKPPKLLTNKPPVLLTIILTSNTQESLGGLTPSLYYTYRMTGIFPADQYFGMNAGQLNDVKSVIRWMQNRAEQAREKGTGRRAETEKSTVRTDAIQKESSNGIFMIWRRD